MAVLKTKPRDGDVAQFIASIANEQQRKDAQTLCQLMARATGEKPVLWGTGMVGFGVYHYKYASGHEGDWFAAGFAPRKSSLTVYVMDGLENYRPFLDKLGKHSTAKSCLYIKHLDDIDLDVLAQLVATSFKNMQKIASVDSDK
ncbi:MAG TPA: DUF1801 domain-containing protein [Nevskiaceae bacterium]|nr:DUF1801 domain-containing protein [Nevskiaceae bacterium]